MATMIELFVILYQLFLLNFVAPRDAEMRGGRRACKERQCLLILTCNLPLFTLTRAKI